MTCDTDLYKVSGGYYGRDKHYKTKDFKTDQKFLSMGIKKKGLTETEKDKYLLAKKSINKIIKEKEDCRERGKHKKFIPYDHKKAAFLNKRGY